MKKELYDKLQKLVDGIEWDVRVSNPFKHKGYINNNNLSFVLDIPSLDSFINSEKLMIEKKLQDFLTDYARPILSEVLDVFISNEISECLALQIKSFIKKYEGKIINDGGRSIKDEIRFRLGLMPDFSNFKFIYSFEV